MDRVRRYAKSLPLEETVENAVDECIREGILTEFLKKNRAEAIEVSIYEYNEEQHIKNEREIAYKQGIEQGIQAMVLGYIEDGKTREEILAKIQKCFQLTETEAEKYYVLYAKK